VDPAHVVRFQAPSNDLLESAQREQHPLVVVIVPSDQDNERLLYGQDFADMSREKATFVKVVDSGDRDRPAWEVNSTVPTSPLLSANPARDFNAPAGRITILVCDWFGNEYQRFQGNVRANSLERTVQGMEQLVEGETRRLERLYERAEQSHEREDVSGTVRSLVRVFAVGRTGLEPVEKASRLYHELCDKARQDVEKLVADGDEAGLRELERTFRNTDMADEIAKARASLRQR
jgi:hypothetical protein